MYVFCTTYMIYVIFFLDIIRKRDRKLQGYALRTITNMYLIYFSLLLHQFSMFHRAFFNSIIDKTPTLALFIQHYISLAC